MTGDVALAIVAPSFNAPSETFIRNHVRTIARGRTVLLCNDGTEAGKLDCPVLSGIDPWRPPRTLPERIVNGIRRRWRVYVDPGVVGEGRRRALAFLGAHRLRAVLAEYGPTGCLMVSVCREARIPLYVHFHGYDASMLVTDWRQRRHYRKLFKGAAGIIAPSRFLAGELARIGCPADRLHVVPYGIDFGRFKATRRLPERLVAVGRLVEKKAPHLTIQAFARVSERHPRARLDIIGDGPLAGRCADLVDGLGLGERVRLHGARDSDFVAKLMGEASMFIQHSVTAENGDTEGLPVAVLEAMASALPVVSTRHSGIPEAVEDGVTGLLVLEHDVEGMAAAIAQLLDDPERAARMGVAGRARVRAHFTADHTRDRLRAIMGLPPFAASSAVSPESMAI